MFTIINLIIELKYLLDVILKELRQEYIADLQCIIDDIKAKECFKFYIVFIIGMNITFVALPRILLQTQRILLSRQVAIEEQLVFTG